MGLAVATGPLDCHDWRWITPRITSQVQEFQVADAEVLLPAFCDSSLRIVDKVGATCRTRRLGPAFADIVDDTFHPNGVIYGHFLNRDSDDAAVSGWSAETHPLLWGGTLLLTRHGGAWTPVWYRSAVITDSCRKLALPSGREILLCEDEDGGMGHTYHYLYSVDFTAPAGISESPLVSADSFENSCTIRRQQITRVEWAQGSRRLAVTVSTPEWRRLSPGVCAGDPEPMKRPPLTSTDVFELNDSGFRKVRANP